jgi:hypothetical protein
MQLVDEDDAVLSSAPFTFVHGDNAFCYHVKIPIHGYPTLQNKDCADFDEWRSDIGFLGTDSPYVTSSSFVKTGSTIESPYIIFTNNLSISTETW